MEGGYTPEPVAVPSQKLRPLGLGEVIGGAFEIYGKDAVAMWQIVALVVIPLTILEVIIARVTLPGDVFLRNGQLYTFTSTTSNAGGVTALFVLNLLGTWLAAGALFHLQLDSYLGRPHTPANSLTYFSHRMWSLIWLGIIVLVFVVVGFVLLILPGIYLLVSLAVAFPVLMLEGKRGFPAVSRSLELVQGRWWVTFGRLIVAYLIAGFWTAIVGAIGGAIGNGLTNVTVYEIVRGLANTVGFILAYPFITAVINLIYLDLRVRKDGLTDEMLMERPRDPAHTVPGGASASPPPEQGGMPSPPSGAAPPAPEPPADAPPPPGEPPPSPPPAP